MSAETQLLLRWAPRWMFSSPRHRGRGAAGADNAYGDGAGFGDDTASNEYDYDAAEEYK